MRIRRLEISAFRCFSERVVIEAIGDGITLLVGDNEEGKSTVLAALQTVLSEKHNAGGAVSNSFLPYGMKVRPEIWLEFDLNGVGYRLHKAFCQKPAAELEAESGGRWTGDAVEEKIRELLEFTSPSRGKTKPDHRGLLALFWVEQGYGHRQPHINETAHSSLAGALEKEVGTVTGGERGRALTKHIQERLSNNQTPKTRKPAGDYKDAKERVTELQGRHEDLSEKLRSFEEKVETLSQDRERLGNLEADDPIGSADARLSMAKKSVREVEGLEHNLKTSRANLKMANAQRALADALVSNRNKDRNSVIAADQEVDELKNKQIAAEKVARNAKEAFNSAKKLHDGTKTDLATAQSNAKTARRRADFLQHQSLFENARTRLKKAEKAESDATDLTAKANANLVTPEALEQLRELDANARDVNARLKAVATRLEFMPEGGRRARIDGKNIEEDALTLTEPTQIDLEDYGGIRVLPGGEDLVSRREAADKAVRELDGKCDKFGVTALQDATKQGNDRESWLNEAAIHRTVVDAQAPEGLEALREEVANLMAEAKNVEEDLGDTGTPDMKPSEASDRADELE
ncbi:MAG: AAA family ATPase, partial [Pseudomonadota bacterium]|nr:AAA family ATPase [Pseudomonadota bacterium]